MTELDALLAGIISEPLEETRWLVLADWLEENDEPRRADLLRLHRRLIATCCEPDSHLQDRREWQGRVVALLAEGVPPCVPGEVITLPGEIEMGFAFIPPGTFRMGSEHTEAMKSKWCEETEGPVHSVTLTSGFFMGMHPVTQAQWKAVMGTEPSHFKGPNRPIEQVSWDDCQEFCEKLTERQKGKATVRLPTEAEWEYACRAGTTTEYWFGDVIDVNKANYNGKHQWNGSPKGKYREETTDVGSVGSKNPWGLSDVHGNVWEWCQDAWDEAFYARSPGQDPVCNNNQTNMRVVRGGSWYNDPQYCRSAYRNRGAPADRGGNFGFRVCFRLDG